MPNFGNIRQAMADEFAHLPKSKIKKRWSLNCFLGHPWEPSDWEPSRIAYHKRCLKCGKDVDCHDPYAFV